MAIVNVSSHIAFENEQSKTLVDKLANRNLVYNYCISYIYGGKKCVAYIACNSDITFGIKSSTTLTVLMQSTPYYITHDGVEGTLVSGGSRDFAVIDAGTDVRIRPCLYRINPPTVNSNDDLGNMIMFNPFTYSIMYEKEINLSITEEINDTVIRNFTTTNGTQITCDIGSKFNDLSYGKHTIKIIVNESESNERVEKNISFNKIKAPITPIPTDSTLTQSVNHMIELNKEIDYQELKLSNNLVAKGVEVLPTDKMSNLIDKVGSISTGKKWASGIAYKNAPASEFTYVGGGTYNPGEFRITLDFIPSTIIALGVDSNGERLTVYTSLEGKYTQAKSIKYVENFTDKNVSTSSRSLIVDSTINVSSGVYRLPMSTYYSPTISWVAYE